MYMFPFLSFSWGVCILREESPIELVRRGGGWPGLAGGDIELTLTLNPYYDDDP